MVVGSEVVVIVVGKGGSDAGDCCKLAFRGNGDGRDAAADGVMSDGANGKSFACILDDRCCMVSVSLASIFGSAIAEANVDEGVEVSVRVNEAAEDVANDEVEDEDDMMVVRCKKVRTGVGYKELGGTAMMFACLFSLRQKKKNK